MKAVDNQLILDSANLNQTDHSDMLDGWKKNRSTAVVPSISIGAATAQVVRAV